MQKAPIMTLPNWMRGLSWTLFVVPVLATILGAFFVRMTGDYPADPEYSYLLNGLEVLTFYPPSYISHPGTNLIMLMAVVNFFAWLVTWPFHHASLVTDVLSRSQFYLSVQHAALMAAIAGATLWFGMQLRRVSGSLVAALAGQASILLSYPVMIGLNRVAPEPLLLASTLVLAAFLVPLVFGKEENPCRTAVAVGIMLGFSMAAKINALPLVFALLLLPDWRMRKRAALFAIGSAIAFTLPAAHHYPQMFRWFTGMATHSEAYTGGARGLPPVSVLLDNTMLLLSQAPAMFVAGALYAILAVFGPRLLRRVLLVSALVLAVQILIVVKQPTARYLIPAATFSAFANAALVAHLISRGSRKGLASLALLGAVALGYTVHTTADWLRTSHAVDVANKEMFERLSRSDCAVIQYYEASSVAYSLDFGNQYAGSRFRAQLQALYPRAITYDLARSSFMLFGDPLSLAQVQARIAPARCIYLAGSPLERFGSSGIGIPSKAMTLIERAPFDNGRSLAIYRYRP
jgi:hypothetical protein